MVLKLLLNQHGTDANMDKDVANVECDDTSDEEYVEIGKFIILNNTI